MQSLKYVVNILDILKQNGVGSIYQNANSYTIPGDDGTPLVRVCDSRIEINKIDISDRLHPQKESKLDTKIDIEKFKAFMRDLSSVCEITLSHLGISYYCRDMNAELSEIRKLLGGKALYEDDGGSSSTKWLFIGNTSEPGEPLFEMVVNERAGPVLSSWVPHFQIDIDTELTVDNLREVIKNHFGEGWIKWSMEVEGYGTPLVMGRLCSIDGTKVYLTLGTSTRDRVWHRRKGLYNV